MPRALFNEARYLANNPDVAALVASGATTAYAHYILIGNDQECDGKRPRSLPIQAQPLSVNYHPDDAVLERLTTLEIEKRALLEAWDRSLPAVQHINFDMVSEPTDDVLVPPLDRRECDEAALDQDQLAWRRDGYLIKPGFMPNDLIERYCAVRAQSPTPDGWRYQVPYMHVAELREISLYPPLMRLLAHLFGEELGLHLNLTGWVSSDRNWHQDDYLNPPYVNSWYAAVWMALDDIHPDCGPFEFVPGSHLWAAMRSHKVRLYLTAKERDGSDWPAVAERFINDLAEREIAARGLKPERFLARKGDLLIWHGRLMHRGSTARVPGMQRKALISHYSAMSHRFDMPDVRRTPEGSAYFHLLFPLDAEPAAP